MTFVGQQTVNDANDWLMAVDQNHYGQLVGVMLAFAEKSTDKVRQFFIIHLTSV